MSLFEKINNFVNGTTPSISEENDVSNAERVYKHHEKTFTERIEDSIETGESKPIMNRVYNTMAVVLTLIIIGCLLYTVSFLPHFGNPNNPANNEVSRRYIVDGIKEGGAINLVGNMILDYRAFDTLGESHVLFIAACAVTILLARTKTKKEEDDERDDEEKYSYSDKHDLILRKGCQLIVPAVLMFGIYVILNGHLSAGGGFSGGAIMGAGIILYNLAFGDHSTDFISSKVYKGVIITALCGYAFSKTYSFYTGANHIHSALLDFLKGTPGNILSAGFILFLNICVGIIVSLTMYGFYSLFDKEEI